MAERISLRAWITNLGSGSKEVSNAIIAQGLDSISDLAEITVEDANLLCATACRPGEQIKQLQHDGDGAPNICMSNPSVKVPARFLLSAQRATLLASRGPSLRLS